MYAWKYWRDSRAIFQIAIAFEVFFVAMAYIAKAPRFPIVLPVQAWQDLEAGQWLVYQRYFMLLIIMQLTVIGSSVSNAISSNFTLTRPLARWRMIWIPFGQAGLQFAAIFAIDGVSAAIHVSRVPPSLNLAATPSVSVSSVLLLLTAAYFLAAMMVRSGFVLLLLIVHGQKRSFAIPLVLFAFTLFTIAIVQPNLSHPWIHWLPMVITQVIARHGDEVTLQPHLFVDLLLRCALVLGLTFVSQKVLERREV